MDNIKNPIQPQDGLTDFDFEPVPDRSAIVDHIRPSMRYWPEVGKRLLKNKVAMFAVFLLLAIIARSRRPSARLRPAISSSSAAARPAWLRRSARSRPMPTRTSSSSRRWTSSPATASST